MSWAGLLGAWCLAAAVLSGAPPPLVVNVDEANPPFMYGDRGRALGLYPRLIKAAFGRMQVAVSVEAKPWKRALAELEEGRAGVAGLYKNSERLRKLDYSQPLFTERLVVYYNTDNPVAYSRIKDLEGRRVGVIRGWSYGDDFDDLRRSGLCSVEEVNADDQNFHKLATRRLDAVIAISEAGATLASGYGNIRPAAIPLALNPTFLAFAKAARRTDLLKRFDAALEELRKSGEFQRMVQEELTH